MRLPVFMQRGRVNAGEEGRRDKHSCRSPSTLLEKGGGRRGEGVHCTNVDALNCASFPALVILLFKDKIDI